MDLKYPDKLQSLHNDYPLAQEKLEICLNILSRFLSDIADQYDINIGSINK